ncbi:hypothetical protein EX461_18075 [Vibrio parahaemolyticus]|nr:hypothetical protein [Vibrio parahaemolyticus]
MANFRDLIKQNGGGVYSPSNKPSPSDIGAYSKDEVNDKFISSGRNQISNPDALIRSGKNSFNALSNSYEGLEGDRALITAVMGSGGIQIAGRTVGNEIHVRAASSNGEGEIGEWHRIYTTGYKPNAADVGAYSKSESDNKYLTKTAKAADADKLDGLDSGSFVRSNADDTLAAKLVTNGSDRTHGIYGTYDSSKISHVWSMGASYRIDPTGANFGNLYGLAYKHTNNPTGGSMAGGHQIVWVTNGVPQVALGDGGVWTNGFVQADEYVNVNQSIRFNSKIVVGGTNDTWLRINANNDFTSGVVITGKVLTTATQGTDANALTRKDYVDSELAKKLNLAGGTVTGDLTINGNLNVGSTKLIMNGVDMMGANTEITRFGANARTMKLNAKDGNVSVSNGSSAFRVYHEGYKPTSYDVGAVTHLKLPPIGDYQHAVLLLHQISGGASDFRFFNGKVIGYRENGNTPQMVIDIESHKRYNSTTAAYRAYNIGAGTYSGVYVATCVYGGKTYLCLHIYPGDAQFSTSVVVEGRWDTNPIVVPYKGKDGAILNAEINNSLSKLSDPERPYSQVNKPTAAELGVMPITSSDVKFNWNNSDSIMPSHYFHNVYGGNKVYIHAYPTSAWTGQSSFEWRTRNGSDYSTMSLGPTGSLTVKGNMYPTGGTVQLAGKVNLTYDSTKVFNIHNNSVGKSGWFGSRNVDWFHMETDANNGFYSYDNFNIPNLTVRAGLTAVTVGASGTGTGQGITYNGKTVVGGSNDTWLRLNPHNSFSGIYCANSLLRTDNQIQVGSWSAGNKVAKVQGSHYDSSWGNNGIAAYSVNNPDSNGAHWAFASYYDATNIRSGIQILSDVSGRMRFYTNRRSRYVEVNNGEVYAQGTRIAKTYSGTAAPTTQGIDGDVYIQY